MNPNSGRDSSFLIWEWEFLIPNSGQDSVIWMLRTPHWFWQCKCFIDKELGVSMAKSPDLPFQRGGCQMCIIDWGWHKRGGALCNSPQRPRWKGKYNRGGLEFYNNEGVGQPQSVWKKKPQVAKLTGVQLLPFQGKKWEGDRVGSHCRFTGKQQLNGRSNNLIAQNTTADNCSKKCWNPPRAYSAKAGCSTGQNGRDLGSVQLHQKNEPFSEPFLFGKILRPKITSSLLPLKGIKMASWHEQNKLGSHLS